MYQCLNLLRNKNKREQHKQSKNSFVENLNSKVFLVEKLRVNNNKNNISIMQTTLLLKLNTSLSKMILLALLKNQEFWKRKLRHKRKQHRNLKRTWLNKYQVSLHLVNGNKYKMKKKRLYSRGRDPQIIKAANKIFLESLF